MNHRHTRLLHQRFVNTYMCKIAAFLTLLLLGAPPPSHAEDPAAPYPEILASLHAIVLEEARADGSNTDFYATDSTLHPGGELGEALDAALQPFAGQPLRVSTLAEIRAAVAQAFRSVGQGPVRAAVPEQDVTDGTLTIVFARGRVGEVTVSGNRRFDDATFLDGFRLRRGDVVDSRVVLDDMDWLTRNSYRWVTAVYRPGEILGEVDVDLVVVEQKPWNVFAGYDREGTELLGEDRLYAGVAFGSLWGADHRGLYQYFTDADFDSLSGHFASYTVPLPWRHELQISGNYADTEAVLDLGDLSGDGVADLFDIGGESWEVNADYIVPLPRFGQLKSDLVLGFDFKSSNSNLQFGDISVLDTNTEILQLRAEYRARLADKLGVTAFGIEGVWSPGGLTGHNSDEAFAQSRALSSADYFYGKINVDRRWNLPWNLILRTDLAGQIASDNLLASEQSVLAGDGAVRGFERSLVRGDHGLLANVELAPEALHFRAGPVPLSAQPFAFTDYGWGRSVDRLPGEPNDFQLGSAGVGLRANIAGILEATAGYAWQYQEDGFEDGESGRWHLGVTVRW